MLKGGGGWSCGWRCSFSLPVPVSPQALVDLLLVSGGAVITTVAWYHVSPPAARLLYPYLAWLAFATLLNYRVWQDNRGRRGDRHTAE